MNLILREAGEHDAITVWNAIPRAPAGDMREQVVARLEKIVARPEDVTHEAALQLDGKALRTWREAIP